MAKSYNMYTNTPAVIRTTSPEQRELYQDYQSSEPNLNCQDTAGIVPYYAKGCKVLLQKICHNLIFNYAHHNNPDSLCHLEWL